LSTGPGAVQLQATQQLCEIGSVVRDLQAFAHTALSIDDAHRVRLAGPIQPAEGSTHGQPRCFCGLTCRVGSPSGSLSDRRSWRYTLGQHPVPCHPFGSSGTPRAAASYGTSHGQRYRQSLPGARKSDRTFCRATPSVKPKAYSRLNSAAQHGLTTLRRAQSNASREPRAGQ